MQDDREIGMKPLTRRQTLWLTIAAFSSSALPAQAADDGRALFWQLDPPGSGARSVIFGYVRIAAALVPEIVDEGTKKAAAATRVIQDFHATVKMPSMQLGREETTPIIEKLDGKTGAAFRAVIGKGFPKLAATVDRMTGIEATMLLMFEGQTPSNPTVGGTIVEGAAQAGRPATVLVADDELRTLFVPPDLASLDKAIGEETIAYMLQLRERTGPIGHHFEQLYQSREGGEIRRISDDLRKRGVFSSGQLFESDKVKALLIERMEAVLDGKNATSAFILLPLGTLLGDDGVLAVLRKRGHSVTPIA
jgi:hypothetical protein